MPSKQHTTIVLNKSVQKIKDELTPIYGLKNIVSAGLLLFSKLSDSEQKKIIAEVGKKPVTVKSGYLVPKNKKEAIRALLRSLKKTAETEPMTVIKILSQEDQKVVNELRELLAPAIKKVENKKQGG